MTGGMESLNPPVGAWVVLAQDGESTDRTTRTATGIRGKYLEMNFFIGIFPFFRLADLVILLQGIIRKTAAQLHAQGALNAAGPRVFFS